MGNTRTHGIRLVEWVVDYSGVHVCVCVCVCPCVCVGAEFNVIIDHVMVCVVLYNWLTS